MKGKIDKNGHLWIERAGEMIRTECPFQNTVWIETQKKSKCGTLLEINRTLVAPLCGDWCPLFGEPIHCATQNNVSGNDEVFNWRLLLCHKTLLLKEFTDERGKESEP